MNEKAYREKIGDIFLVANEMGRTFLADKNILIIKRDAFEKWYKKLMDVITDGINNSDHRAGHS